MGGGEWRPLPRFFVSSFFSPLSLYWIISILTHEFSCFYSSFLLPHSTWVGSWGVSSCVVLSSLLVLSHSTLCQLGMTGEICPERVAQPISPSQGKPKSSHVVIPQAKAGCGQWAKHKEGQKLDITSTSLHKEKPKNTWRLLLKKNPKLNYITQNIISLKNHSQCWMTRWTCLGSSTCNWKNHPITTVKMTLICWYQEWKKNIFEKMCSGKYS